MRHAWRILRMSVTFGPAVRLRSRSDFSAVQQQGRRCSVRLLTVLGRPNGLQVDRLGLVVSRRVGGAVKRNRVKRRLREAFRQMHPDTAPKRSGRPALDFVVIAKAEAAIAPGSDLRADLLGAIRRLESGVRP